MNVPGSLSPSLTLESMLFSFDRQQQQLDSQLVINNCLSSAFVQKALHKGFWIHEPHTHPDTSTFLRFRVLHPRSSSRVCLKTCLKQNQVLSHLLISSVTPVLVISKPVASATNQINSPSQAPIQKAIQALALGCL